MRYIELLDELGVDSDDIFKYMLPETRDDYCDKLLKKHYIEKKASLCH